MKETTNTAAQPSPVPFDFGDLVGEAGEGFSPVDEALLRHVTDPGSATESIHWGRNYLYAAPWQVPASVGVEGERLAVVVKQFRNAGFKAQWRRKMRGTKAARSFRVAQELQGLGVGTPEPVLFADSVASDGPSFFLSEHKTGLLESRYLLRSLSAGTEADDYPSLDCEAVFLAFGLMVRSMHDGRIWHRDLTCGNLLIDPLAFELGAQREAASHEGLLLLDLNRARTRRRLTLSERMRDLCRLEVPKSLLPALWSGYFASGENGPSRSLGPALRNAYAAAFLFRNRSKRSVRGVGRRLADMVLPRRKPHAHIPATSESSAREKIVWDQLSDQPHQHASKWEKLRVRLVDAPEHVGFLFRAARAYPQVKRQYQARSRERLGTQQVPMDGFGVGVRPWPKDPGAVVTAVQDLGVRHVLLRLHPWQEEHTDELELAQALVASGADLAFSLPQDRSLVRDPELWRRRVAGLAQLFAPLGQTFQVGQAVNRSKWGVWRPSEYKRLFQIAAEELRAVRPEIRLLGPAVIDFEFHQTMGYVFDRSPSAPRFDGLASLLYVDRRGAPENPQMGLDAAGKGAALRAIADTAPCVHTPPGESQPLNWVTEVNWPLWEGPHSPAGRDVAVSEEDQAAYLARYYLSVLASGAVERVYWWQMIAKGYGLVDWQEGPSGDLELRRRPSFIALQTLVRELSGSQYLGPVGTAGEGQWLLRFATGGGEVIAGWSSPGPSTVDLPSEARETCGLDGEWSESSSGSRARLKGQVQLFRL